jgi:hypothetical protein
MILLLAAAKLTLQQKMLFGAFGAMAVLMFSFSNWRRAVYMAMLTALFEGAIRKWILPQASELVYFLKDGILLGAYLRFYMFPDAELRRFRLQIPGALIGIACMSLVITGALNSNLNSVLMALYGLKIYLWYVPLAFMIPALWQNEEQMTKALYWYALMAIPICFLGGMQFVAPVDSWLNTYADTDYAGVKQVATFGAGQAARARVTGTFSYISGHAVFVTLFFVISLSLTIGLPDKRRILIIFGNLPLLFANGLMSGSRSAIFYMVAMASLMGLSSGVTKMSKKQNSFIYLLLAIAAVAVGVSVFFDKALAAFETRRATAGDSVSGRTMHFAWSIEEASKVVDISGFGIGTAHPATWSLRSALQIPQVAKVCPLYDAETGQVLAELGWPGFIMWYLLRIMMLMHCFDAYRKSEPSMFKAMALGFTFFHLILITSQMVYNHTANIFLCATWGFCLINRLESTVNNTRRFNQPTLRSVA